MQGRYLTSRPRATTGEPSGTGSIEGDALGVMTLDGCGFDSRSVHPSRGRNSAGRVPALQAGCHRFEPVRLHTFTCFGLTVINLNH